MDPLIVMDDVLGIADNCKKLPENQIWQKILLQTNIFNIFPSSVPYNTVAKILHSNCRQITKQYFPACSMLLNRVFSDLANTDNWL